MWTPTFKQNRIIINNTDLDRNGPLKFPLEKFDNQLNIILILYLSKACHTIAHNIILQKLNDGSVDKSKSVQFLQSTE